MQKSRLKAATMQDELDVLRARIQAYDEGELYGAPVVIQADLYIASV